MNETVTESEVQVELRWMKKSDLSKVIEIEHKSHEYDDPDFGVPQLPSYAWDTDDVVSAVKQYKSKSKAENETRSWVVDERVDGKSVVSGALIYEMGPAEYEIILMSATNDLTRKAMLDHIKEKMEASPVRKKCVMVVPDGDYKTLKFLMNNGFTVKLVPHKTNIDVWRCEFKESEAIATQNSNAI